MSTNDREIIGVVKNGSFETPGTGGSCFAYKWFSSSQIVDGAANYVASRVYLSDTRAYACEINTKSEVTDEYDWPRGIYQKLNLTRATSESELTVSFDVKKTATGTTSMIDVWLFKRTVTGSSLVKRTTKTSIGYSWAECSFTFRIEEPDTYYLFITGYCGSGGANGSIDPLAGQYYLQRFYVKNIQSRITNCTDLLIDCVTNGEFANGTSGWAIRDSNSDHLSHASILNENGDNYLNIASNSTCKTSISQGIKIPYSEENPFCIDFHFSYRLDNRAKLNVSLDGSDVSVNKTLTGDSRGEWKRLSFSSQDFDISSIPPGDPSSSNTSLALSFLAEHSGKAADNGIGINVGYEVDIDDIEINIFNIEDVSATGNDGTFEKPYTTEDGRFLYKESTTKFKLYSGEQITKECIVAIPKDVVSLADEVVDIINGNTLYLINSNGEACKEGFHNYNDKTYFTFSDGRIAFNEQFIYEYKVYRADEYGTCIFIRNKLYYIDVKYKDYRVNSRRIETPIGSARLELVFPEQNSAVAMTVVASKGNTVIKSIEVVPGLGSNIVDLITEYGLDTLTISYIDEDGDQVVSYVTIHVIRSGYEYDEEISINIISDVHYVALNKSLSIPYVIRPNLAVTVDVDWLSSDESVALVDVYGNIKPMGVGNCTITAINYNAGISDTCELYVVENTTPAYSIEVSDANVELGVSDSVFIETAVLNRAGTTTNTSQEVKWESENSSIASVENGYIIGTGQGTTKIYCYSYYSTSIVRTITVNVSGEVTAIKEIELNMYETMLNAEEPSIYEYIGWSLVPPNTNQAEVIWTSDNTDTVKVAKNGRLSVGDNPVLNVPVLVKCTSVSNPEIYRECIVTVVEEEDYMPTITMKDKKVRSYVGKTIDLSYGISLGYDLQEVSIERASGIGSTTNTATIINNKIRLNLKQAGEFILTASYTSDNRITSKTCEVTVYEADEEPQYIRNLDVIHSFQDGSYILGYFAVDSDDDLNLTHYINIDNEENFSSVKPELLLYDEHEYYYIFGYDLDPGSHTVQIKVIDTDNYETISDNKTIIIPSYDDNKTSLENAKTAYDEIKNDLLDCLRDIIKDEKMALDDKREFVTRYKIFNMGYDNLLKILDQCVKHINSQIETSQAEMATLSDGLGGGVAVATYSEGDYTNSNFETVTDMDYYQNECIKKLAARILELEARLDELTNNNN